MNKNELKHQGQLIDLNDEIIDKAPIGLFVIDTAGKVLKENPALKKILEMESPNDSPGIVLYDYIKSEEKTSEKLDEALRNRNAVRIDRMKFSQHPHNNEKIFTIWIVPIFGDDSNLKQYLFFVEDKTQFSLHDSKIQRSERLSAMSVMASGIAEEIKWPMSHIMINLDFVERNTPEDSPMRSYIKTIRDDLSRIKFVSKQIVSLSQPNKLKLENMGICEINDLFSKNPLTFKLNVLKESGINIKMSIPDKPIKIRADENQLIQALSHIIQNAAEAMPGGEGTLTLSMQPIIENNHEIVVITISDTGIGISKESMENVFKPFFTTKGKNATGLGLMVSYSVIDNLGGAIGIKSTPGEGTSVQIVLPAVKE